MRNYSHNRTKSAVVGEGRSCGTMIKTSSMQAINTLEPEHSRTLMCDSHICFYVYVLTVSILGILQYLISIVDAM